MTITAEQVAAAQAPQKPADIILAQLGGSRRLRVMIGASDMMSTDEGRTLAFKFKASPVANFVRITLTARDTYDVRFAKIRGLKMKEVGEMADVYADTLKRAFESFTKLALSL